MDHLLNKIAHKKHVIWDWNGTLLDDVHHAVNTINGLLKNHSLPLLTQEQYKNIFGFPVKKYYEKLGFDFDKVSFEDLSFSFVDSFMKKISDCQLFPHVRPLLGTIKSSGKRQSILSAADQDSLNFLMKRYELEHYLDDWFGISDIYASSKLEQGRKLLQKSQIDPQDTVLIGDTDHDFEVGKELGIDVILVSHGHQCERRLKALHHDVVQIQSVSPSR